MRIQRVNDILKNGLNLVVDLYDCETMVDYRRVVDQLIVEAKDKNYKKSFEIGNKSLKIKTKIW